MLPVIGQLPLGDAGLMRLAAVRRLMKERARPAEASGAAARVPRWQAQAGETVAVLLMARATTGLTTVGSPAS